jgi:hypothetical protein
MWVIRIAQTESDNVRSQPEFQPDRPSRAEPAINRARSLRAYSRNQQIAVENMIARQENEWMLPKKADWHSLLTRTV